jgi:rsbT co-antagonist protein RsbR
MDQTHPSEIWSIRLIKPANSAERMNVFPCIPQRGENMAKETAGADRAKSDPLAGINQEVSMDMLQVLVDNIREYSIIMLNPRGLITTWSPTAERIKGYRSEEAVGKHFSIFYTREDAAGGKADRELEAAAREGRFEDEGWRVRKDGSKYWANVVLTSLRDSQGKLRGFGKVTRDMSERKAMEDRVKKQTMEIMEMATVPVVQVWDGIMLVPLIGMLDSERTQQLIEKLLRQLTETNSRVALLDITGVPAVDTQTAQHIIETIKAVRSIGAEVVLTGVRPSIAQTLVHLGIDLSVATTRSSLKAGLQVAFDLIDLEVAGNESLRKTAR